MQVVKIRAIGVSKTFNDDLLKPLLPSSLSEASVQAALHPVMLFALRHSGKIGCGRTGLLHRS